MRENRTSGSVRGALGNLPREIPSILLTIAGRGMAITDNT